MKDANKSPAELAAFRSLTADAQRAQLVGQRVERLFTVDRDSGIDEKKRTVWLSIASEEPYERWWGTEVLAVDTTSIRDQRLKSGAPLLVGHDTSDQVGVVESFEITSDKRLRILARFGRSARAEEIFRDVLDGIRRNTSVGYIIHDLVLEKQEEGMNTYRVTDWEPLEGSLVAVPADPTVGVGRSLTDPAPSISPTGKDNMKPSDITPELREQIAAEERAKITAEQAAAAATPSAQQLAKQNADRCAALAAAGEEFAAEGGREVAQTLIADPNGSLEQFKARMFERQRNKQTPTPTAQPAAQGAYGAGARVLYSYGNLRAFKDLPVEGGATMKAEEAAYRAGMWLAATIHNKPWAKQFCRDNGIPMLYRDADGNVRDMIAGEVRAQSEGVLSAGGALVPVEMEAAIINLRDSYGVLRQLARTRPMSSDQLKIPRRKSGLTAYFFQDDDGVGITESQKAWDNVTLSTKKLGVLARVSRDLVEDAVISVVDDLANEMAYAFAVKEDQCWLVGDGTSTYGGMQGLITKFEANAYISRTALTTGHDTFAEVDNTDITSVMGNLAQYADTPNAVFLCSHLFKHTVFSRLKATAGGNRVDTLGGRPDDYYLGYRIYTSEAMPKVLSTLQNKVMFLFGRFDLSTSIGNRRGIEMQTLVERYAELGQIGVIATERFDIVNHDLGTTSSSDVNGGRGPVAAGYGA